MSLGSWAVLAALFASAGGQERFVAASVVNVRASADQASKLMMKLPIAQKVLALEKDGEWTKISTPHGEGWVQSEHLEAARPSLEDLIARHERASELGERRKWIERAAALASDNPAVLKKLVDVLKLAKDKDALRIAKRGLDAAEKPALVTMFSLGSMHADETPLNGGERVFALSGKELRATRVRIGRQNDPVTDDENGLTGKIASVDELIENAVIFLTGPFQAGAVTTAEINFLKCNPTCTLNLGSRTYEVRVVKEEALSIESGAMKMKRTLEISDGTVKQLVLDIGDIVWAGDLDRDGRLDLIAEDVFHENVMESKKLFLSTQAKGGLFGIAASFRRVGC